MWKPKALLYPLILLALILVTEARTRGGSYRGYRGYRGGRYSGSSISSTDDGAVIAAIVIGSLFGVALLVFLGFRLYRWASRKNTIGTF